MLQIIYNTQILKTDGHYNINITLFSIFTPHSRIYCCNMDFKTIKDEVPETIGVAGAAALTGMTEDKILYLIGHDPGIPSFRMGYGRYFDKDQLTEWNKKRLANDTIN